MPDGSPNPIHEPLGNDIASGFGWEDVMVYKFGVDFKINDGMALRKGYSVGDQPIPDTEVMFNILAPGVVTNHLTLGLSKYNGERELSFSFMYTFDESVTGPNPFEAPGQQTIEIQMKQFEFQLGFVF